MLGVWVKFGTEASPKSDLETFRAKPVKGALHEKSGNSAFYVCGTFSVYLCVLCGKYIGANVLTQSTQRYTEIRRETRTANEPTFRAKPVRATNCVPKL